MSTCGQPLRQHVNDLFRAIDNSPLGGACEDTYRALLEVAAVLKQIHSFGEWTPQLTQPIVQKLMQQERDEMGEGN